MRIAIIRGPYLNEAEMANYQSLTKSHQLVGIACFFPIHRHYLFPLVNLPSPVDLPDCLFLKKRIKMAILNRLFGDALLLFGLENFLAREKEKGRGFDIAHVAETYFSFSQQCLDAKKRGYVKKVIATVWENIPHNHEGIRQRKRMKKRAIINIDHFLAVTKSAKEALIAEGCQERKISVIPMGVDINKFKAKSQKLKVKTKKKRTTILFVGRLEREKGVWEILKVFKSLMSKVKGQRSKVNLRMVGDGGEKVRLIQKVKEWGLSDKVTIEQKRYEDMPLVYQAADIFVLASKATPYWQEQFGMVLVEAMASGLPIVATRTGAIPEVVGDSALLVPPQNSQALYNGLIKLLTNEALRSDLKKKARKRAKERYDSQKVARKIERLYQKILKT